MDVKNKISEIKDINRKIAEDAAYEWWHSVDKEFVDVIDAYVNGVIYGWNNPIKLKEVDLDKEITDYLEGFIADPTKSYFIQAMLHFFELGFCT